jgi:hypothetical protein
MVERESHGGSDRGPSSQTSERKRGETGQKQACRTVVFMTTTIHILLVAADVDLRGRRR